MSVQCAHKCSTNQHFIMCKRSSKTSAPTWSRNALNLTPRSNLRLNMPITSSCSLKTLKSSRVKRVKLLMWEKGRSVINLRKLLHSLKQRGRTSHAHKKCCWRRPPRWLSTSLKSIIHGSQPSEPTSQRHCLPHKKQPRSFRRCRI